MATPTLIAGYLLLFAIVGVVFLFANLLVGWLVRPRLPNTEKEEVYECGEPTVGSSFVQFDLRFYVVALLFIIFDVEVAFFFPWATVFGKSTQLAAESTPVTAVAAGDVAAPEGQLSPQVLARLRELGIDSPATPTLSAEQIGDLELAGDTAGQTAVATRGLAKKLAWTSLADIGVFFAVLMVGFAYVWRRGDLDWVRAVETPQPLPQGNETVAQPTLARTA